MQVTYNFVQVKRARCETAVKALRSMFSDDDSDEILLVDAEKALNQIHRNVMLHICHKLK